MYNENIWEHFQLQVKDESQLVGIVSSVCSPIFNFSIYFLQKNNVYLPDILYDVLQAHLFSSSPSGFFLICRFQIWERAHSIYLGLVYFASYDDPWFHQFSCKWWFFFLHDKAILCFCLSLCVCMCPCVCGCVYPWMLHYTFFIHSSITWLISY